MFQTVVIPTKDRAKKLEGVLNSLINQTIALEFYEVIVVDNGSVDETKLICDFFKKEYAGNFRYFYVQEPGLHVGRNLGMEKANGDIITYLDDDVILFPNHLLKVKEIFNLHTDCVLAGGNIFPQYDLLPKSFIKSTWDLCEHGKFNTYLSLIDFGDIEKEIDPLYIFGCNFSVRRDFLKKIEGFHPDNMPDKFMHLRGDGESYVSRMVKELGYIAYFSSDASVYHIVDSSRMRKSYFCRIAFRQGVSTAYTDIRSGMRLNMPIFFMRFIKQIMLNILKFNFLKIIFDFYNYKGYIFLLKKSKQSDILVWIKKENYLSPN
jgi:glycosyltransferase involved in cell wall biosynthesis